MEGDNVLEQTEYLHDANGNVILTIAKQRFHDETDNGELGDALNAPLARVSYAASYFDAANRLVADVNFGTNGGSLDDGGNGADLDSNNDDVADRPASIPARSDTVLVNSYSFAAEIQQVAISGAPTGGTFTLTFDAQTTSAIAHNAAASTVQTALRALSNIGDEDVLVGGPAGGPYVVRFVGALGNTNPPAMTASSSLTGGSTPGVTITTPREGLDAGRVESVVDPRGIESRTEHDLLGRTTRTIENYVNGTPSDADDRITAYTFDGLGQVRTLTADLPSGQNDQVTEYIYTPLTGTGITRSGSNATATVPNHGFQPGDVVVISGAVQPEFNGTFTITSVLSLNTFRFTVSGTPSNESITIYVRRAGTIFENDRLKVVKYPDPSTGAAGSTIYLKEFFHYDALGELIEKTDRSQNTHVYTFDVMGRQTADTLTIAGGIFLADGVRQLATKFDTGGRASFFATNYFEYEITGITYSSTTATATVAGEENNPFGSGQFVEITGASVPEYNGTFEISNVDGQTFQYTMLSTPSANETGLNTIARSVKNVVEREFNGLGQLTTEYQQRGRIVDAGTSPKVQYAYDDAASADVFTNGSRLKSMTYPNGRVLHYGYGSGVDSNVSRVSFLADDSSGSPGTHLEDYSYLGLGTIVQRSHAENNVVMLYANQLYNDEYIRDAGDKYEGLDRFGRVTLLNWAINDNGDLLLVPDQFLYTYDRNSNRLTRAQFSNSIPLGFDEAYTYDGLNRLATMSRGTISSGSIASPNYTRDWGTGMDALGNWTSLTTDADGSGVGSPRTENRTHDSQNRLTVVGSDNLLHDHNGNLIIDENGNQLTPDGWDRLASVAYTGGSVYYEHDALGRRIAETKGGTTTQLFYSQGWQVIEEREGALVTAQNVWSLAYVDAMVLRDRDADDDDQTGDLGIVDSGLDERLYAAHDANFNVTALINTSGDVVERYQYDPYGSPTILDENFDRDSAGGDGDSDVDWKRLHQGGAYEALTGLYFFNIRGNGRNFSPTLGRAIEQDRWRADSEKPAAGDGFPDGCNSYQWELSGPTNLLDPEGTFPWKKGGVVGLLILAAYGAKKLYDHAYKTLGDCGCGCKDICAMIARTKAGERIFNNIVNTKRYPKSTAEWNAMLTKNKLSIVGTGYVGTTPAGGKLPQCEQDMVDYFENEYLSQNPDVAGKFPIAAVQGKDEENYYKQLVDAEVNRQSKAIAELEKLAAAKGCVCPGAAAAKPPAKPNKPAPGKK